MSPSVLPDGSHWTHMRTEKPLLTHWNLETLRARDCAIRQGRRAAPPSNSSRAKLAAGKMTYSFSSGLGILIRRFLPLRSKFWWASISVLTSISVFGQSLRPLKFTPTIEVNFNFNFDANFDLLTKNRSQQYWKIEGQKILDL